MEYTCPYCGRKSKSEDFIFDFTDFISSEISRINSDKLSAHIGDIQKFLSDSKEQGQGLYFSVLELSKLDTTESLNIKYSKLEFDKEKSRITKYIKNTLNPNNKKGNSGRSDQDDFSQAAGGDIPTDKIVEEISEKLTGRVYFLKLHKSGDEGNNAEFDTIQIYSNPDSLEILDSVTVKRCPNYLCHMKLSYYAGMYPQIVLSVLGGQRISKTSTITACYDYFKKNNANDGFNVSWEVREDDVGVQNFLEKCYEPYTKGYKVAETERARIDEIPKLTFHVKINRPNKKIVHLCLTFVDLPGEFCRERDNVTLLARYRYFYQHVDYLLYCIEPSELGFRLTEEKCGLKETEIMTTQEHEILISNIKGLFQNSSIVPTLFILGKSDLLGEAARDPETIKTMQLYFDNNELPENIVSFYNRIRGNDFSCDSYHLLSEYVYSFLEKTYKQFIDIINSSKFSQKTFVSVSAYGFSPVLKETHNPPKDPKPYNIALPFYWILAHLGYLCVSYRQPTFFNKNNEVRGYLNNSQINDIDEVLQPKEQETAIKKLTQS